VTAAINRSPAITSGSLLAIINRLPAARRGECRAADPPHRRCPPSRTARS
jgi:hypothetical protein